MPTKNSTKSTRWKDTAVKEASYQFTRTYPVGHFLFVVNTSNANSKRNVTTKT